MAVLTIRGQNYKLGMATTQAGTKVELAGGHISMRTINIQRTRDARTAPGGGSLGRFYSAVFSVEVDSNAVNDPLLERAGGARMWCTARPQGGTTSTLDFEGVIGQCSLTASQEDNSCRWSFNMTVDGDFDPFA